MSARDFTRSERRFGWLALAIGLGFAAYFFAAVAPAALESGDVVGAFRAGFVNPFAAGYSTDVILCALLLITWILHESRTRPVRHGWWCIPLTFAPGVATAFGVYLFLRSRAAPASHAAPPAG